MIASLFGRANRDIPPDEALVARPVRLVDAEMKPASKPATWHLAVPVRPPRWAARFLRLPEAGATKKFEFDSVGVRVWNACDGRATVRDIAADLAREYGLSPREAEVATRQFLRTLALKGLIGVAPQSPEKEVRS